MQGKRSARQQALWDYGESCCMTVTEADCYQCGHLNKRAVLSNPCHTVIHLESPLKTLSLANQTSESKDSRVSEPFCVNTHQW